MIKIPFLIGKVIIILSKLLNIGGGSTWPGHMALSINPHFISDVLDKSKTKIILIIGTNGKTTTGKLVKSILEEGKKSVFLNQAGANLLNGVASAIISSTSVFGTLKKDYSIFEVDENTVPLILAELTPDYLIALNLFRDQLDRYGEIDKIARDWKKCFKNLSASTTLILNADDPLIFFLSENLASQTYFFGIDNDKYILNTKQNAADSTYCLFCGIKLTYNKTFFSHLGDWYCNGCGQKRPKLNISEYPIHPLSGTYNIYNVLASVLIADKIGVDKNVVKNALLKFEPAFGRQEIIKKNNKEIQIFLSKNPASFNESLRTIGHIHGKDILIVLNDRIPDGRDISWIWDTDMEKLLNNIENIIISGDRAYEMSLRIKYSGKKKNFITEPDLKKAIEKALIKAKKRLFILPTYSAMLDVRKILTGKKFI